MENSLWEATVKGSKWKIKHNATVLTFFKLKSFFYLTVSLGFPGTKVSKMNSNKILSFMSLV